MKTSLKIFSLVTVMALIAPFSLQAGEVSLEQVQQNVRNLHKSVMETQPAISVKKFRIVMAGTEEFVLLDVRSESEYLAAHLPGALHVERGRIEWIIPTIIKNTERTIYVYCQDGRRSAFATERLLEMGYKNAIHITEGFEGWVAAGNHVFNMHGEFILSPGGYDRREPVVGNIKK